MAMSSLLGQELSVDLQQTEKADFCAPGGYFDKTSSKTRKFCMSASLMRRVLLNTAHFHPSYRHRKLRKLRKRLI